MRKHDHVRAHHRRNGTTGTNGRNGTVYIEKNMRRVGNQAARQVKNQKAYVADHRFDVVGKNPEEKHVAHDVADAAMQKHTGEEGVQTLSLRNFGRDSSIIHDELPELIALIHFNDENQNIQSQESVANNGVVPTFNIVIANWEKHNCYFCRIISKVKLFHRNGTPKIDLLLQKIDLKMQSQRIAWSVLIVFLVFSSLKAQMSTGIDTLYGSEWIVPGQVYYKIKISEDGVYRLNYGTLQGAGVPLSSLGSQYQLFQQGKEVPLFVSTGNSPLQTNAYLEFVAQKNRGELDRFLFEKADRDQLNPQYSLVSDTAVYFLTIASIGTPTQRYSNHLNDWNNLPGKVLACRKVSSAVFSEQFNHTRYDFENLVAYSSYDMGEGFGAAFSTNRDVDCNLDKLPGSGASPAQVRLRLCTNQSSVEQPIRLRSIRNDAPNNADGQWLLNDTLGRYDVAAYTGAISSNALARSMKIRVEALAGGSGAAFTLAFVELEYSADFSFNQNTLARFWVEAQTQRSYYEITDFDGGEAPILYLQNPQLRVPLEAIGNGQYRFTLPALAKKTELWLINPSKAVKEISQISPRTFEDFRNTRASYIIITHQNLRKDAQGRDNVEAFAAYRRSSTGGGYQVLIADVQQIFDQFGYGVADHPQALRNFGAFIKKYGQPKYMLLIGHGIEYNLLRQRNAEMRPEHFIPTFGTPGSDNLLFAPNGKLASFIPTGRLAVLEPVQILDYLNKLKEYEQALDGPRDAQSLAWRKRVLHISGGNYGGNEISTFQARLKRSGAVLSNNDFGAIVTTVSKQSAEAVVTSTAEEIINAVNDGVAIKVFLGHGSVTNTDFGLDDPLLFDNTGHYPLIFSLGCLTGKLYDRQNSLSERFILTPKLGGIGYIASSGFANDGALEFFLTQFYQAMGGPNYLDGVGDITNVARRNLEGINSFIFRSMGEQISYHGDPALKLNRYKGPDFTPDLSSFRLQPSNPTVDQDSFSVAFSILNLGQNYRDSLRVNLKRILPNGQEITYPFRLNIQGFADTIQLRLPTLGKSGEGKNRLLIEIDPNNRIAEVPNPAAENNNRLFSNSGQEGLEFVILANDFAPLSPANFGIYTPSQRSPVLFARTGNQDQLYRLELDTTALFNSPALLANSRRSEAGLLAWSPKVGSFQSGLVYYWRIRPDTATTATAWRQSSFLYKPGGNEGWNQSHYFQFSGNNMQQLNWNASQRKLEFQSKLNNIIAESVPTNSQTNAVPTRYLFNNNRIFRDFSSQGVIIAVFDPFSGQPWYNSDGPQRYGSQNGNDWAFTFPTNTTDQRNKVIQFMNNEIPKGQYVLFMTVHNLGQSFQVEKWAADSIALGTNLFQVLERNGAQLIRDMVPLGSRPYVFAYIKGGEVLDEALSIDPETTALIRFDLPEKLRQGSMSYQRIGPAKSWREVLWEAQNDSPRDSLIWRISAMDASGKVGKILFMGSKVKSPIALTELDATQYPYLELKATFQDSTLRSPAQLDYWRVHYDGIGDAVIKLGTAALPDTIDQGQPLSLRLPVYNLGNGNMDSLQVMLTLTDAQNNSRVQRFKTSTIATLDSFLLSTSLETRNFKGLYQVQVELNPERNVPEINYQNNLALGSFFVRTDRAAPLVDVTFDGQRILHKDLVSAEPFINITLRDENKFLLLEDTSLFEVRILPPQGSPIVLRFNQGNVRFIPAEKAGQSARIEWQPQFVLDGEYQLLVRARDASGNLAGGNLFQVSFRIVQEQSLSQLLPYPNPFTSSCRFVYTLTGKEEPAYFSIQILTVSGQVVKEVSQNEFGAMRIGTHLSDFAWDGKDQYGDQLANGVYLYRVVAKDGQGKAIKLFSSAADPFFDKGFGKIVLLR